MTILEYIAILLIATSLFLQFRAFLNLRKIRQLFKEREELYRKQFDLQNTLILEKNNLIEALEISREYYKNKKNDDETRIS